MAYRKRNCISCTKEFTPPHRATNLSTGDNHITHCPSCRRLVKAAVTGEEAPSDTPIGVVRASAPMKQVVFDLETWGLDRGWGVTLVGSFLIHGGPDGPTFQTITLRDFKPWQEGRRSDDRDFAAKVFEILKPCHLAYAHNGDYFDVKWLRTVALKYGLEMPKLKLVDPCALARQKYLIGRNSLELVADFLGIKQQKLHVSTDVWRRALMDNSDVDWAVLKERCESDVTILNEVSARVTGDVGMIDYRGSWR